MADKLDCALDLMRRLPPSNIEDNLAGLIDIVPELMDDLLSTVDQPLKIAHDNVAKRDYLLCDYNRDGDSYRSPWSNKYDPPMADGAVPSQKLRSLETQLNDVFDIYREMYYEGGVSSVYCWEVDGGFAACILIKKTQDQSKKGQPMKGSWDSIHVMEANEAGRSCHYKLTSTVMLSLVTENDATGKVNLAGSLTRQEERDVALSEANTHTANMGRMIEDMEFRLRQTIEQIYFGKTKEVFSNLRTTIPVAELERRRNAQGQIGQGMRK